MVLLPAWRDVIRPQSDVRYGNFKQAEFAADLTQIGKIDGRIEYIDPAEFFRRTYLTEGIKGLLAQALRRAAGKDGEPVIQLKTAFGGGKTHSMFALYHFMRGNDLPEKIPELRKVLDMAGVSYVPKTNVAVIVGTSESVSEPKVSEFLPGVRINTIWGRIAEQLAKSAGNPGLYEYVRSADETSTSPGSRALRELFDACGPCVILFDEIVAYARKLEGNNNLPAGTFGNFLTFIQEITEAARSSKNSMIAAAIPESDIEVGGDGGREALAAVEHTFGRMESIWKPVAANEGFEVVRRRLFEKCYDIDAREKVATEFSRMYTDNRKDFPTEAGEIEYKKRIISCYPIHPEIFDRLYEDWATLEDFQRTRGVLRLMALVIHALWMSDDKSPLIMPGTIPLDVTDVRSELIRYLPSGWDSIAEREIDGKNSTPYKTDKDIPRFGKCSAARRVARAVMLGSAPTSRSQAVRGIDKAHIRLGVVQPDESIADYNDALGTLQGELSYLYTDSYGNRFWYDTRPTLLKTVKDRATQISDNEVKREIISRLKKIHGGRPFAGVHLYDGSSGDIPDEQTARLVILGTDYGYVPSQGEESPAVKTCAEILNKRGNSARINRNMLMFLAPDQSQIDGLKQEVRLCIAWREIDSDKEKLNLDASQARETRENISRCNRNIDVQISSAWCWLIAPYTDRNIDINKILWSASKVINGEENVADRAAKTAAESLAVNLAPFTLKMELDGVLWKDKDDISVKTLWEYFCMYCYLQRLSGYDVLESAIMSGVSSGEYFALAESKSEDGKYIGLKYKSPVASVSRSAYLVKKEAAYIVPPKKETPKTPKTPGHDEPKEAESPREPENRKTSFYLSVKLDKTTMTKTIQDILNEIIPNLKDCKLTMSLELNAESPEGFTQKVMSTVEANCETLKFEDYGF